MWREAISIAPENCVIEFYLRNLRCMEGLEHIKDIGIISEKKFRAYKV